MARNELQSSRNYRGLEKAFPELANFIAEEIQPCRDTNPELWAVTSLCNDNKDNDFLPTVVITAIENFNAIAEGIALKDCKLAVDADKKVTIIRSRC